ncbi:MAG: hypothetical protein AAF704_11340, partial [Cyanobacteria bacterium P01_D01_bin.123]
SFLLSILDCWLNEFHLEREQLELTSVEVEDLNKYLEINNLILKCRNSAKRLSRDVWEGIESRIFLLKDEEAL